MQKNKPIRVMSVFGTRPEAIKMLPLVQKIEEHPALKSIVCVTAQHREMLDQVLHEFNVTPDYDLNLMTSGQTLTDITSKVLYGLGEILSNSPCDIVLVHGDTTTSFAAALASFYQKTPVGHVEAGLRTYNPYSPFPEEMNRNLTTKLAALHFAPTQLNRQNLQKEGVTQHVYVTGNTVIDALFHIIQKEYTFKNEALRNISFADKDTVLLTSHRRENLGEPMRNIFSAVLALLEKYPNLQVIYPVHKNPAVQGPAHEILGAHPRAILIDPIEVSDMHNLYPHCHIIMTDSGGLQEEAPALGKPTLVLRTETERPEAVAAGTVKVVGINKDDIVREASLLMDDTAAYQLMSQAKNPYGDGHASERICDAIATYFDADAYFEVK